MSLQRWLRLAFWAAVVFTFVMATLPQPPQLPGSPSDKVQHILAFTTLAILAVTAYGKTSVIKLLLGLGLFGALIEAAQMVPALHRDAEVLDWAADVVAVTVVLLVATFWHRLRRRRTNFSD